MRNHMHVVVHTTVTLTLTCSPLLSLLPSSLTNLELVDAIYTILINATDLAVVLLKHRSPWRSHATSSSFRLR